MNLRILYVSNFSSLRCGVAEWGRQCFAALQAVGANVIAWDGEYGAVHAREERQEPGTYLPADAATYDVIHLNWHPGSTNHYQSQHFPEGPLLSILLHDLPPWSHYPALDRFHHRIVIEPTDFPHDLEIPPPAVDYRPTSPIHPTPLIGRSNVRSIGQEHLGAICADLGYEISDSLQWLDTEDEIERLARCWVNVVWYDDIPRSRGSAAVVCAASRRPLVLSDSPRFDHLLPFTDELYIGDRTDKMALRPLLQQAVEDVRAGRAKVPDKLLTEHSWQKRAREMVRSWEEARP